MDWVYTVWYQWWAVVNTVMNRVLKGGGIPSPAERLTAAQEVLCFR
jgi:hypothetical protein